MSETQPVKIEWKAHSRNLHRITRFAPEQPILEANVSGLSPQQYEALTGEAFKVRDYLSNMKAETGEVRFFFGKLDEARGLLHAFSALQVEGTAAMKQHFEDKVTGQFHEAHQKGALSRA